MSTSRFRDPCVGGLELSSIARGYETLDAMIKQAAVAVLVAEPATPGKYVIVITGSVDAVRSSLGRGAEKAGDTLIDHFHLSDLHDDVLPALERPREFAVGAALGIIETRTVSAALIAADAALKTGQCELNSLRLAQALDGKGVVVVSAREVSDVSAAVRAGALKAGGNLVAQVVIPRSSAELVTALLGRNALSLPFRGAE